MKVTSKQFMRAKRKVFVEFIIFEIIGSILITFLLWVSGSMIVWNVSVGDWHVLARVIYTILLVCFWLMMNLWLVTHADECYQNLKKVKDLQGLDEWCIAYGFKFIN